MIKKLVRNIAQTNIRTNKPFFYFHSEVNKFDPSKDYYNILQVTKGSSDAEVKKSYYRLAKIYHPDTNPGKEKKFKQINEAYTVLSDEKIKRQYEAARSFQGFASRMRNKVNQGSYSYEQYRGVYQNMSAQEREQIYEEMKARFRKGAVFGLVLLFIFPFLTRRNHQFYVIQGGELMPVQFEGGMYGGMMPPATVRGSNFSVPYGGNMAPYGSAPYNGQYGQNGQYPSQQNFNPYSNNPSEYQSYYNQHTTPYQNVPNTSPYGGNYGGKGCC